jgi:hypothetical protein
MTNLNRGEDDVKAKAQAWASEEGISTDADCQVHQGSSKGQEEDLRLCQVNNSDKKKGRRPNGTIEEREEGTQEGSQAGAQQASSARSAQALCGSQGKGTEESGKSHYQAGRNDQVPISPLVQRALEQRRLDAKSKRPAPKSIPAFTKKAQRKFNPHMHSNEVSIQLHDWELDPSRLPKRPPGK